MENFNFKLAKQAVEKNKAVSRENTEHEFEWGMHDSPLVDFGKTFIKTLPREYTKDSEHKTYISLKDYGEMWKNYIEETLSKNEQSERKAIEFGGPGSALFKGFSKNFFTKTLGVCLDDIREPYSIEEDAKKNHSVISGDILDVKSPTMHKLIAEKLAGTKADLIISRMMGPLKEIDKHPVVMSAIIKKWYEMLNEGGLMFIQFEYKKEHNPDPYFYLQQEQLAETKEESEKIVEQWGQQITNEYKDKIELQIAPGAIRLYKKLGAPEKLSI